MTPFPNIRALPLRLRCGPAVLLRVGFQGVSLPRSTGPGSLRRPGRFSRALPRAAASSPSLGARRLTPARGRPAGRAGIVSPQYQLAGRALARPAFFPWVGPNDVRPA